MGVKDYVLKIVINGSNRTGKAFKSVAAGAVKMAAVVTAAFTASAFSAGKFEKGLAEISTLLDGDVAPSIERMRTQIADLSMEFGQSLGSLTKAQYDIVSAGFTDAADAAEVLRVSTKLAMAGVSDVSSTADLLTTALNGLGRGAGDTEAIADVLFQTVRKGKTTMDQLAASFGPVFASARVAGIGIEELGGVMATLTAAGVNTAESATALNALLRQLAAPTGEAGKALAKMGINLDHGLTPALVKLGRVSEGGLDALARVVPNIRALKAAAVAATDVELLTKNINSMATATGVVDDGVAKMQVTFDSKFKEMKASLAVLTNEVGGLALPYFTKFFDVVSTGVETLLFLASSSDLTATHLDSLKDSANDAADAIARTFKSEVKSQARAIAGVLGLADAWDAAKTATGDAARLAVGAARIVASEYDRAEIVRDLGGKPGAGKKAVDDFVANAKRGFAEIKHVSRNASQSALTGYKSDLEDARAEAEATGESIANAFSPDTILGPLIAEYAAVRKEMADTALQADAIAEKSKAAADALSKMAEMSHGGMIPATPVAAAAGPQQGDNVAIQLEQVARAAEDARARTEDLRGQLEELAVFTKEDFANMAFSIGDSMGSMLGDVASHLLKLKSGPIVIGEAFKSMANMILAELGRVIARMLVAKALLSIFGLATGGGGGVVGALAGSVSGGMAKAASGMAIPGGGFGGFSPGFVLPGAVGVDRTLVMAHGGEVLIPRQAAEAVNRAGRRSMTKAPPARRSRGRQVAIVNQVSRPFNRQEQTQLADSVTEGIERSSRYRG